jgi:GT2 family glycosyltransferase
MSNLDRVGVVVPSLGERPEMLLRCLDSIRQQNLPTFVVLVDSSQGRISKSSVSHLVDRIVETKPSGLSSAINEGFKAMGDRHVAFTWVGDDDLLEPGGLSSLFHSLHSNPNAPFSAGGCNYLDEKGRIFWRLTPNRFSGFKTRYVTNAFAQPACLIRSRDFRRIGGADESLRLAMDLDIWLKLSRLGKPAVVSHVVASYTWHHASLSASNERRANREAIAVRRRNLGLLRSIPAIFLAWTAMLRSKVGASSLNSLSRSH